MFAHAFGQRYELPIPLLLFVLGGAAVVFLSFLVVLPTKVSKQSNNDADITHIGHFSWPWAIVSFAVLGLLAAAGLLGSQEVAENILPTVFWLIAWIVVPLTCGLIGDWTQRSNPFANIALLADSDALRQVVLGSKSPVAWPQKLGWWPAVGLFFALASGELIYNETATLPAVIGGGLLAYAAVSAVMGFLFGRQWLRKGEVFTVLYATWGKLGYWRFGSAGQRGFAGGLAVPFEASASRISFVLLLLVSVSFDGLLATPAWSRLQLSLPAAIATGSLQLKLLITGAFIALALLVWLLFRSFAAAVVWAGKLPATTTQVLAGLLASLVPISFGYLVAHNVEYIVVNCQLLFPLIGNPTGLESWPIHLPYPFNDSFEPHIHLLPSSFYWYMSVVVIIAVHIVAIVLAHRYLKHAARDTDHRKAQRSEYPWILAMVVYTMLSLWLLAQPLVN